MSHYYTLGRLGYKAKATAVVVVCKALLKVDGAAASPGYSLLDFKQTRSQAPLWYNFIIHTLYCN